MIHPTSLTSDQATVIREHDRLLALVCEELQITLSMHDDARLRYETIGGWLSDVGSPLAQWRPQIYPQGSLRIGTTVRPRGQDEFDVDLVCQMDIPFGELEPAQILNLVESRLREHGTYGTMVERLKRCIRINYAGNFHLDILPAIPEMIGSGDTRVLVPDRKLGEWLPSNPRGYAHWFLSQAERAGRVVTAGTEPLPEEEVAARKATLKKAVQLLKRWRDIAFVDEEDRAPRSIVLTTLAAQAYEGEQSTVQAFSTIIRELSHQVRMSSAPLSVVNPANEGEVLSERWINDPDSYALFVERLTELESVWQELSRAQGLPDVQRYLERLFGEKLAPTIMAKYAKEMEGARANKTLGVNKKLGLTTSSVATPIARNTFYGGELPSAR